MQFLIFIIIAAIIFGICRLVDNAFTKAFRSKAQHRSGMAVRAQKKYGIFGVALTVISIMAIMIGIGGDKVLLYGGFFVLLMGVACITYYLSYGIFYDGETFLVCIFGKKSREYHYSQILSQKLYVVTGGNIVIELHIDDGTSVSLQSAMDGVYPFLDTAFAGWCMQTGHSINECDFYDPSKSWWFPHEEA